MSEQIDWSKAPEWASVRIRSLATPTLMAWAESYTEGVRFLRDDYDGAECRHLAASFWELVAARPTTPSWSGEGLPPVGVVLEVNPDKAGWRKSVISYVGDGFIAWMQVGDLIVPECGAFIDDCEFRPIRTTEQIAADEQETATDVMFARFGGVAGLTRKQCAWVISEGYRKP